MPITLKPEEYLPENIDEVAEKAPDLYNAILIQTLGAILLSKNITNSDELEETSKRLWKIQRDKIIQESKNA